MGVGGNEGEEGKGGGGSRPGGGRYHWKGGDEEEGCLDHYRHYWEGGGFIGGDSSENVMFQNKCLFLHQYFVNINLMQALVSNEYSFCFNTDQYNPHSCCSPHRLVLVQSPFDVKS